MTVHEDELLLDSVQRLVDQSAGLSGEMVNLVLQLGNRVVNVERALEESKRDRAQLRTILAIVVFIFVLAIAVQIWRG